MSFGISMGGGGAGGGGITKVADAAARLALVPANGDIVIQLDTDLLYEYDLTTLAWVIIGGVSPTFTDILVKGSVQFEDPDAGTNKITMTASTALAVDWTFTLPTTAGTANYPLITNGSGVSSWSQLSLTAGVTGVLPIANGGTNSSTASSLGAVVYSTASAMAYTAVGSANQILMSAGAATPVWSTATYPATTVANQLLYSSATNVIGGVAVGTTGQVLRGITAGAPTFGALVLTTDVTGVLPIANGGTNSSTASSQGSVVYSSASAMLYSAVGTTGQALISGGTGAPTWYAPTATNILFAGTGGILASDTGNFTWDSTNHRLFVGTGGITVPRENIHIDNGNATASAIRFTAGTTTGTGSADGCSIGILTTGVFQLAQLENLTMVFRTNNAVRLTISAAGSVYMGNGAGAALATSATDGFLYLSSSAGTPTGVPTANGTNGPIHLDSTNNLIYYYSNSQWRTAGGYVVQNTRQTGLSMSVGTTITAAIGACTTCFVVGNGGAITITAATPIVTTNMQIGQILRLCGTSDTNTVTYDSGNNLVLNGSCTLAKDSVLTLMYAGTDGTNLAWIEVSRT